MNAGKSTVLLQSDYNYRERGMDTLLYTSMIDTRFSKGKISSRIGLQANAISVDQRFNIYQHTAKAIVDNPNIHCILVDEAHFLTKAQIEQLSQITDILNI